MQLKLPASGARVVERDIPLLDCTGAQEEIGNNNKL